MIHDADQDGDIKFIVIVGEGKNFCTGNDLTNFSDPVFEGFTVNVKFLKFRTQLDGWLELYYKI